MILQSRVGQHTLTECMRYVIRILMRIFIHTNSRAIGFSVDSRFLYLSPCRIASSKRHVCPSVC